MARPKKCRKVCCLPSIAEFEPKSSENSQGTVIMTVDEYETVRLIDYREFTQEECSQYMKIARTTVQQIYNEARKKISIALVEGKSLKIIGGDYTLCDGKESFCGCGGCHKHRKRIFQEENK